MSAVWSFRYGIIYGYSLIFWAWYGLCVVLSFRYGIIYGYSLIFFKCGMVYECNMVFQVCIMYGYSMIF